MSLKENLLKKMELDRTAARLAASLRPTDTGVKIDRQAARMLLETAGWRPEKRRDLELWIGPDTDGDVQDIVVLDGELKRYRSRIEDVAMRKSPTVKEMVKIRNAIKILSDKDIVVSSGRDTAAALHALSLADLDLTVTEQGVRQIAEEGAKALANRFVDGVDEALALFAELLGWRQGPSTITPRHCRLYGRPDPGRPNALAAPCVLYVPAAGNLYWIDRPLAADDPEAAKLVAQLAGEKAKTDIQAAQVFEHLARLALETAGGSRQEPPAAAH